MVDRRGARESKVQVFIKNTDFLPTFSGLSKEMLQLLYHIENSLPNKLWRKRSYFHIKWTLAFFGGIFFCFFVVKKKSVTIFSSSPATFIIFVAK